MKPSAARRKLLHDIFYEPDPNYKGQPLELPANLILRTAFPNMLLDEWCNAVGVSYTVNTHPDPAFACGRTILFRPSHLPNLFEYNIDDEL